MQPIRVDSQKGDRQMPTGKWTTRDEWEQNCRAKLWQSDDAYPSYSIANYATPKAIDVLVAAL
jgi:hypothetical protein